MTVKTERENCSRLSKKAVLALCFLAACGMLFGGRYVMHLDNRIRAKFEGQKWKAPAKVFSGTFPIYPGLRVDFDDLRAKLGRLGYREIRGRPRTKGAYRLSNKAAVVEIYLRDFEHPLRSFRGFPVRLILEGEAVAAIENMSTGGSIPHLELEPELLATLYDPIWEQRTPVTLAEVPPLLLHAILAVEDENFYRHRGIDAGAVVRAFVANLRRGKIVQGGSTITQQLMKNLFLTHDATLSRKLQEAIMALLAEWRYPKDEIFENYLNAIYLGQNGPHAIFGVGSAAKFYFSKDLSDLTVGEISLLAGLIKAPNRYSPFRHVGAAARRRDLVLGKLFAKGIIAEGQYESGLREVIRPRRVVVPAAGGPFFVDYVKRELATSYSRQKLTTDGLRVFTTLDSRLQQIAENVLAQGLKELEWRYPRVREAGKKDRLEGAVVAIEPQTGEIKAMVGGRSYQKSPFNRAVQARRQVGSVAKPFVYLAALLYGSEDGKRFTPATLVEDSPFLWSYEGEQWRPKNINERYFGTVTFGQALERSLNAATARIAREVGIGKVRDVAHFLGIESRLPLRPSLALGAAQVSPLEVARAFSTLANGGVRTDLVAVKAIADVQGRLLHGVDVETERVITPPLAFVMNHLLMGVFSRGTALGARFRGFDRPAAGKSGSTNRTRDAWFVGYTPDLVTAVWVGFDNESEIGLSGAEAALPIWTEFMKQATAGSPVRDFPLPPGVVMVDVGIRNGILASPDCSQVVRIAFLESNVHAAACPPLPTVVSAKAGEYSAHTGQAKGHGNEDGSGG